MRLVSRLVVLALAGAGLLAIVAGGWLLAGGISARPDPSAVEVAVARRVRAWLIPAAARERRNPVPANAAAIEDGLRHFADHCAVCHANNGSGRTPMGGRLYPRSPDLRSGDTQALSDGALFYIIEEGVRLTGMPGWGDGTGESAQETWQLVHFIRHLPRLTDREERQMEALNPRTEEEWRMEDEERRFLEGGDSHDHAEPPERRNGSGGHQ